MPSLAIQIEAILYLKGQALSLDDIAKYAGCDPDGAADCIIELMGNYAHRDTALEIIETADRCYALQLKESLQPLLDRIVPAEIGTGALRTLAAIALKGPIPQSELVELRGGSAYQHVQELVELGLVRKRRQTGNRSSLVLVTDKFKQTYELKSGDFPGYLGSAGSIEAAEDEAELSSSEELDILNLDDSEGVESLVPEVLPVGNEASVALAASDSIATPEQVEMEELPEPESVETIAVLESELPASSEPEPVAATPNPETVVIPDQESVLAPEPESEPAAIAENRDLAIEPELTVAEPLSLPEDSVEPNENLEPIAES
jgi:segregation and condensation protein B